MLTFHKTHKRERISNTIYKNWFEYVHAWSLKSAGVLDSCMYVRTPFFVLKSRSLLASWRNRIFLIKHPQNSSTSSFVYPIWICCLSRKDLFVPASLGLDHLFFLHNFFANVLVLHTASWWEDLPQQGLHVLFLEPQ
jgi:hypothetical protein